MVKKFLYYFYKVFERADDYGRSVVIGQHYLVGNFLEKTKSAKKGLFFKLSTKTAFFLKESIVYPFVQLQEIKDEVFLSQTDFTDILNFVDSTGMTSLLSL